MKTFNVGDRVKCLDPRRYGRVGFVYATVMDINKLKNLIQINPDISSNRLWCGYFALDKYWTHLGGLTNEDDFDEEWI